MSQSLLAYYFYRVAGSLGPRIPRRFGYWLAAKTGCVAFYASRTGATALKENLSHVFGAKANDASVTATALKVFANLSKNYFDLFHKHALDEQAANATVTIRGVDHLGEALENGRGLVLVSAHFGPFDALWQIASALNLNMTIPAEHLKPEKLYQYVCKLRASDRIRLLPIDGPLLGVYRALRRGETVGVAADRDITRSGILVDFFDAPARLPDGHVQLALRTGAMLTTCFALRQPDNSSLIQIEPPLQMEQTGDFERDVRVNVRKVVARMEEWISRYPEQWLMLYPIWRDATHGS